MQRLNADVVWRILSNESDYKAQLRFSRVCEEWELICKTLPRLHISIPVEAKAQAPQIIQEALQGRSSLLDLQVCTNAPSRPTQPPWTEQGCFNALQQVSSSIQKLTLGTCLFEQLTSFGWTSLNAWFPKLIHLHISANAISVSPAGLTFRNLKLLVLQARVTGPVLEEIFECCPSLEGFSARMLAGPVHIQSNSLVRLELGHTRPLPDETVIEACNLRSLQLWDFKPSTVLRIPNIQCMNLAVCRGIDVPPLPELKLVILHFLTVSEIPQFLFREGLKHLVIRMPIEFPVVTLQQMVPPQLELMSFHVGSSVLADNMFRSTKHQPKTLMEMVRILRATATNDELPCFPSLKSVVVGFSRIQTYWNSQKSLVIPELIPILVELLRCSPRLEHLILDTENLALAELPLELTTLSQLDPRLQLGRAPEISHPDINNYTLYR